MNIVVCLKQVPKKDSILRIGPDQKWIDERDISYEMSEADAYALEEALRQKEKHGGEVIVISLGPERVRQSIKEALAKGADRAIHIEHRNAKRVSAKAHDSHDATPSVSAGPDDHHAGTRRIIRG